MRSLTLKLVLAFTVILTVQALLVALLVRDATRTSLDKYIQEDALQGFLADVISHYQAEGSWDNIRKSLEVRLPKPTAGRGKPSGWAQPPPRSRPGRQGPPSRGSPTTRTAPPAFYFGVMDNMGRVVLGNAEFRRGDLVENLADQQNIPVIVDDAQVGTILYSNAKIPLSKEARTFLDSMDRALIYALMAALSIASCLGFWFARTSLKPVKDLTAASRALAAGKSLEPIRVYSQDEIGVLTSSFNHMSAELSRSKQVRKNMTADIAHELRTPLTVLTGYLEAMRDGDLQPSDERLDTLLEEARHLQHLVEDLRLLSLADAGELRLVKKEMHPAEFAGNVVSMFKNQANRKAITLHLEAPENLISIAADTDRLQQVFSNLVSNALRFVPSGGDIKIQITQNETQTTFFVDDNGPGIAEAELSFIFDRFYKADKSRQNHLESTGLGLAISKSIIVAHGGTIEATSTQGKGTRFVLQLPNS